MVANKAVYEAVGTPLNIPWYFIAVIHCMEAGLDFKAHLHNGDPLTQRTVQVPKGRPLAGTPPFTWADSATDALACEGFTNWTDWSIPGMLYCLERYNGTGYRQKGINTPYLWSYSNNYTSGKYVADNVYSADAVSKQCGGGVILRRMCELQVIPLGVTDRISQIKQLGETVAYNTGAVKADNAAQLQSLLNAAGIPLKSDGLSGPNTSNAYFQVAGKYLHGDPRRV
jgi:lysozyme family protein